MEPRSAIHVPDQTNDTDTHRRARTSRAAPAAGWPGPAASARRAARAAAGGWPRASRTGRAPRRCPRRPTSCVAVRGGVWWWCVVRQGRGWGVEVVVRAFHSQRARERSIVGVDRRLLRLPLCCSQVRMTLGRRPRPTLPSGPRGGPDRSWAVDSAHGHVQGSTEAIGAGLGRRWNPDV